MELRLVETVLAEIAPEDLEYRVETSYRVHVAGEKEIS